MYFTLGFEFLTKDPDMRRQLLAELKSMLTGLHWARPLSGLFVVRCQDEQRRKDIMRELLDLTRSNPNLLRFILSPLMEGGVAGAASKEIWPHLNEITRPTESSYGYPAFDL